MLNYVRTTGKTTCNYIQRGRKKKRKKYLNLFPKVSSVEDGSLWQGDKTITNTAFQVS